MSSSTLSWQTGLSLVELMVSLAISLVLVASLAILFSDASRGRAELEKSGRLIENGRYAADLLAHDVAHAGYYGPLGDTALTFTTPADACTITAADWNNTTPSAPVAVQLAPAGASCLTDAQSGTAALVVRRLAIQPTAAASAAGPAIFLQSSNCPTEPAGTPGFKLSSAAADFTGSNGLRNRACTNPTTVRQYITRVYYVAACNECGRDLVPTLKRVDLVSGVATPTPQPLAEGIEDMQIEFGFDTDGNGTPDTFLGNINATAGTNDWANVMAVRFHLLARSAEPSREAPASAAGSASNPKAYVLGANKTASGLDPSFKRRVYSQTVRLNNLVDRRSAS